MEGPAGAKSTCTLGAAAARRPRSLKWSSARYMIFCGAPPHLTGPEGMVKMAFPEAVRWMVSQTYSACSGR